MAVVTKVRRLANPHGRRRRSRNPRRRMTAKQIKFFGTRRQKAGLKAARKRRAFASHRPRRRINPVTRVVKRVHRTTHRARRRKKSVRRRTHNPALVLTLGAVNPHRKRRANVAHTKRRRVKRHANPSRRRRRRVVASAPVRHRRRSRVSNPRRRHYSVGRRRIHNRRRRNPELFGTSVTGMNTVKMVAGGLVGVAVCKFIPTMLPAQFISGPILRVVATGASAFLAGFVARKVGLSPQVSGAVLFGGLMQTGSVALNAFLPSSIATRLALSGMGDIVPGRFPVPQNPILIPAPATPTNARTSINGLDRAYGRSI